MENHCFILIINENTNAFALPWLRASSVFLSNSKSMAISVVVLIQDVF